MKYKKNIKLFLLLTLLLFSLSGEALHKVEHDHANEKCFICTIDYHNFSAIISNSLSCEKIIAIFDNYFYRALFKKSCLITFSSRDPPKTFFI